MATKKISEFTTLGSLSDNDILPVVSGGANKKVTASVLKTYAQTGIDTGNITFSGDQISSTGEGVDVTSIGYSQLSSNNNYVWVDNTGIHIEVDTGEGGNEFTFQHNNGTSKLVLPSGGDIVDSSGNSVLGGSGGNPFDQNLNTTDDVTFNTVTITNATGIENAEGQRITNSYYDGVMYVGSNVTQMPVSILMGGAGPRNEWAFTPDGKLTLPEIGTGIGWTNTDTAPNPDTGFLYSSTISFDKNQGIVLTNNVAGTDITWVIGIDGKLKLPAGGDIVDSSGNSVLTDLGSFTIDSNVLDVASGVDIYIETAEDGGSGESRLVLKPQDDVGGSNPTRLEGSYGVGIWSNTTEPGNEKKWLFGNNGNLKLPTGGDIVDSNGNSVLGSGSGLTNEITNTDGQGSTYSVSVGTDGVVTMNTARGTIEFGAMPEVGGPSHFHIMKPEITTGLDLFFGDDYNYVLQRGTAYGQDPAYGVEIGTNDRDGGNQNVWRFETWGDLTAPGGITASGDVRANGLRINNDNDLVFDQNGSVITEQRPGQGFEFLAVDTVAVTGNGSGAKLNISYGAGDTTYQVSTNDGGTYSYLVGDQLKVTGDAIGGVTPDNDLLVTVSQLYPGDNGNPWAVFSVTVDSGTPVGYLDGLHIRTNGNEWTFGTDGSIRLPNSGTVEIFDDGVTVKHSNYAQLQSNNSYVWVESHSASVEVDGNQWDFNSDGSITLPNNVVQNTGGTISVGDGTPTVIYTTTSSNRHTVKLLVQAEGLDGANENWDTQSCEIVAVKSFRNNTVAASVYGLVYTSPNPLVTYNSQYNIVTGNIEITAVAVQANGVNVRVHAIEISTAD